MKKYILALTCCVFFALFSCAQAQPSGSAVNIYHDINLEVSLRKWETKGAGEIIGSEVISVILSDSGMGDIVILRWAKGKSEFSAEVFKLNESSPQGTLWDIDSSGIEKQITKQADGRFLITHLSENGAIVETFKIPQ